MAEHLRWIALMPLRAGSKSIPGKNIKAIAGRPLFAWALAQAIESDCFDEVCVCADTATIRSDVLARFGESVTVLDRCQATATDDASSESAMLEVAGRLPFDVMALVQATSPLTLAADFVAAKQHFMDRQLDSLVTAVASYRFMWSDSGEPLNYSPARRPRRQDMSPSFVENGAFYFTRRSVLERQRCRLGGRIGVHPMAAETLIEIDEVDDWVQAERLLKRRRVPE